MREKTADEVVEVCEARLPVEPWSDQLSLCTVGYVATLDAFLLLDAGPHDFISFLSLKAHDSHSFKYANRQISSSYARHIIPRECFLEILKTF